MNDEQIKGKMEDLNKAYKKLQEEIRNLRGVIQEKITEATRLEGEYRAFKGLLAGSTIKGEQVEEAPKDLAEAVPDEGKKKRKEKEDAEDPHPDVKE